MAYWQRKSKKGYVFVYFKDLVTRKLKALPREKTKHLDFLPDKLITDWVRDWEKANCPLPPEPEPQTPIERRLVEFQNFMISRRLNPGTVRQHISNLRRFVLPFFKDDPNHWPQKSVKLLKHLEGQGLSPDMVHRCNVGLRKFYRWLIEEGYVTNAVELRLRGSVAEKKDTPLRRIVSPEDVLTFAEDLDKPWQVRFLALAGYFCSLRPQEVFALRPVDFKAGSKVLELECSKAMSSADLFDKMTVYVSRQKNNYSQVSEPKSGSKGWVCCFNEQAARLLIEMIQSLEFSKPVLSNCTTRLYASWREHGLKNMSLKDLRRASLYWLGHNTDLLPMQLQKHARHSNIMTTMKYMRRPEEALITEHILDLDA